MNFITVSYFRYDYQGERTDYTIVEYENNKKKKEIKVYSWGREEIECYDNGFIKSSRLVYLDGSSSLSVYSEQVYYQQLCTYSYDADGEIIQFVEIEYYDNGNCKSRKITYQDGSVCISDYLEEILARTVSETYYNSIGDVTSIKSFEYDEYGNICTTITEYPDGLVEVEENIFSSDGKLLIWKQTDTSGNVESHEYSYDENGYRIKDKHIFSDGREELTEDELDENGNYIMSRYTSYTGEIQEHYYDENQSPIKSVYIYELESIMDSSLPSSLYLCCFVPYKGSHALIVLEGSGIQLSGEAEYIKVVENYNEGFYNDSVVYALNEYKMESLYANITHVYNNDGRSIMTRWEFADGRIHEWYFNEIDENIEAACIYEVYRDADGNIIKEEGKLPQ